LRFVGVGVALPLALLAGSARPAAGPARPARSQADVPAPTTHPPVPAAWNDLWLVPAPSEQPSRVALALATGVRQAEAGDLRGAVATLDDAGVRASGLAGYAHYAAGKTLVRAQRFADARARLEAALAAAPETGLEELALVALAELAESSGESARAVPLFQRAASERASSPDVALAGAMRAATAAGDASSAEAAALRLYFDYPTSDHAAAAAVLVARARGSATPERLADLRLREAGRGERLYAAREFLEARRAFEASLPAASDEQRDRAALRMAECDVQLKRHRAAVEALAPLVDREPIAAEARYHALLAERALGHTDRYVDGVWDLAASYPGSPWTADALNNLASFYIVRNEDDRALEVFARLLAAHPASRHAERAGWKLGWARYRENRYREAASTFDRAATAAPRSDYRPAWLYWAGRAHEQAGEAATAAARYRVAVSDYQHSYYGRLAARALGAKRAGLPAAPVASTPAPAPAPRAVPTAGLIRALLSADLFEFAQTEIQFAQRAWGASPSLDATLAWTYSRQGDLRRGITAMRRAYPQFLTADGGRLPAEMLRVIFPLDYWQIIRRYAERHELDPYLMAALIAQESSFQHDARSRANALGLMQLLPSTGRRVARQEGIRRFSTTKLFDPETNVRLGMRYYAGLLNRLGSDHLALASYNAGASRVARWRAEKPGLPSEEFIDDIPFPETQNYVKRILGTAEDYRRLYAGSVASTKGSEPPARASVPASNRKAKPARPVPKR
jgi:soluble lytic murein transglycosylase